MKNILVPVGSTQSAITNLQYAVNLASLTGATVYLINLYKEFSKVGRLTKVNDVIIEDSEEKLQRVLNEVNTKGVEVISKSLKGDFFEGIQRISEQLRIDLIILSPQSVEIADEIYLGSVTGKFVKQADIPILLVPRGYIFRKAEVILLAFKNGHLENKEVLKPLTSIAHYFSSKINLLHVITPDVAGEDQTIDKELLDLKATLTVTENATIFQGIVEHFQSNQPDILCVFRRKRGFFEKLWEKNTILKKEFYTTKPLLILKGSD
ncbi:MAG: universal stress protein [Flavobacteriaceae bacterium]